MQLISLISESAANAGSGNELTIGSPARKIARSAGGSGKWSLHLADSKHIIDVDALSPLRGGSSTAAASSSCVRVKEEVGDAAEDAIRAEPAGNGRGNSADDDGLEDPFGYGFDLDSGCS